MPTPAEPSLPRQRGRGITTDVALTTGLVGGYLAWLLSTVSDLGYARDEGFYAQAAAAYERWFDGLLHSPLRALSRAAVDPVWAVNHEHPALMKGLFALSHYVLFSRLGWLAEAGTAYRLPGMVVSALAVGLIYVWGRLALGRRAGLVAALAFALLPRVFFHAHLACFDVPVAALWLATAFALWRASERRRASWIVATGVLYGLFLDTKHNAWLFPLVVLAVVLLDGLDAWLAAARSRRLPVPWVLGSVLVLGPLVLYLGWPWLWYDPLPRLADWVHFHTHHDYYNMEFLGRTYWRPPMPRGYAWVMTAATVPGITLVLAVLGIGAATHREVISRWRAARGRPAASGSPLGTGALVQGRTTVAIWLASIAVAYAPWWSADTPIFGGTKHWLGAYPFLCLFVGAGFEAVARRLEGARRAGWAWIPLALAVLAGPAVMTASSHPWGLTFYTPLVGGAPGAATLGLNRTFWGYTTGAVQDELNRLAPPEGRVYLHDTAMQSYALEHGDGRLRPDLGATLDIARSTIALYHHEPHMRRVEHQIWVDYGTVSPAAVGAYDGVPVVWIYVRPP